MSDQPKPAEQVVAPPGASPYVRYVGYPAYWDDIPARDLSWEQWEALTDEQRERALTSGLFVVE